MQNYKIKLAYDELDNVKQLFREYETFLGVNLEFQQYEDEINGLPGKYALPDGRIYVIYYQDKLAGCIALRRYDEESCEIKRLFVRPEFRGKKLGKILMETIIEMAKEQNYKFALLDTLSKLESAVAVYKKMGFVEVEAYYENPLEDVLYFRIEL